MPNHIKKFVSDLRSSSEERKKRYLAGFSAVTMILVVFLWINYIAGSIKEISPNDGQMTDAINSDRQKFWPILKKGTAIIYDNIAEAINKNIARKKEIEIINDENFQVSDLTRIEPREIK